MSAEDYSVEDLEALLSKLRKQGLRVQMGGFDIEGLPTGIASFDRSTAIGGIPSGRLTVIQGEEASGKTMILLLLIANMQRHGARCAFVDLEHALTPSFAELLNVDYDSLVISRPSTLNEAYDVSKELIRSGAFDVVGFDSAAALTTEDAINRSASESSKRAEEAQIHSSELKKLCGLISNGTAFVMINQIREDPSPPNWWPSGVPKKYSPGGRAIRHHASLIVDVRAAKKYKDKNRIQVGHRVVTKTTKNKVGPPFKIAEFDIYYDSGVDLLRDAIEEAQHLDVITRNGSWYHFEYADPDTGELEEGTWNGKDAAIQAFRDDAQLRGQLLQRVADAGSNIIASDSDPKSGWGGVD